MTNDTAQFHAGRAAAYNTCSRTLARTIDTMLTAMHRLPDPADLRKLVSEWAAQAIRADEEADRLAQQEQLDYARKSVLGDKRGFSDFDDARGPGDLDDE